MQTYRLIAPDGRTMEIEDMDGGSVFPYQELMELAAENGFMRYRIEVKKDIETMDAKV